MAKRFSLTESDAGQASIADATHDGAACKERWEDETLPLRATLLEYRVAADGTEAVLVRRQDGTFRLDAHVRRPGDDFVAHLLTDEAGHESSAAFAPDGTLHVALRTLSHELQYFTLSPQGTVSAAEPIQASGSGAFALVLTDSGPEVLVDRTPFSSCRRDSEGMWACSKAWPFALEPAKFTATVDSRGDLHVAMLDREDHSTVRYVTRRGGAWHDPVAIGATSFIPTFAIAAEGDDVVVAFDAPSTQHVAFYSPSERTWRSVSFQARREGAASQLTRAYDGTFYLAYRTSPPNVALRMREPNITPWSRLASLPGDEWPLALSTDSAGNLYVARVLDGTLVLSRRRCR
jgi:hypothetical protein